MFDQQSGADGTVPRPVVHALEATGLKKVYGATVALERADIALTPGKVHALLGENGAGKSTLVRILTGAVVPNAGRMTLTGQPYAPQSLIEARDRKVATAFQELSLVPNLSVAQNLLLPHLPRGRAGMVSARETLKAGTEILSRHGLDRIDPAAEISKLPLADRQRIEITRALDAAGQVLILDEPTASLAETTWLFARIEEATARGVAVLYISHRLAEVREICSDATVLRNGTSVASVDLSHASDGDIFEMMVGREARHERRPRRHRPETGAVRLKVEGLTGYGLDDVSFKLSPGDILGVAALEGQGQHGLFRMLAGLEHPKAGKIEVDGLPVRLTSPRNALRTGSGIAYLPEERKTEGILPGLSAATNVVLPVMGQASRGALITEGREMAIAKASADKVEMNPRYLSFPIGDLSGGNQQKALIARTLATGAKTLLLFDPSRGVDVGTKQSIYGAIRAFAETGGAVLFYSSELPEIVQLADRCLALYGGSVMRCFEGEEITEQALVAAMLGHVEFRTTEGSQA
ncbi:sugar ABC transporter ATP-binding protein [Falsirhodobacter sp. 1013]|uniref:sugar ABC transporter ATP-binding protein n=1 Tax=Falsirhodobacter sp. 1013 TaxID=3417566 RepID=UPI003EBA7718